MILDLPAQNTNAISSQREEQMTILYTISRTKWTRQENTYNLLVDANIPETANFSSIFELGQTVKANELVKFVQQHKLSNFITSAQKYIKTFFPKSKIIQEIHYDTEEDSTQLFLIINTFLSSKDAFKQGRKMFKNWDLAKNIEFNSYISVTTKSMQ